MYNVFPLRADQMFVGDLASIDNSKKCAIGWMYELADFMPLVGEKYRDAYLDYAQEKLSLSPRDASIVDIHENLLTTDQERADFLNEALAPFADEINERMKG